MPEGWEKKFSDKKGKYYYTNKKTKKTSWKAPPGTTYAVPAATTSASGDGEDNENMEEVLPEGWSKKFSDKKGKYYYTNKKTKKTSWKAPPGTTYTPKIGANDNTDDSDDGEVMDGAADEEAADGAQAQGGELPVDEEQLEDPALHLNKDGKVELLPDGWRREFNPELARYFYSFEESDHVQWTAPEGNPND